MYDSIAEAREQRIEQKKMENTFTFTFYAMACLALLLTDAVEFPIRSHTQYIDGWMCCEWNMLESVIFALDIRIFITILFHFVFVVGRKPQQYAQFRAISQKKKC